MNDAPDASEDRGADVDDLLDQLQELQETVDSPDEQREVAEAMHLAAGLSSAGVLGEHIQKYTTRDVAEAFVGAVIFAVPLLVEDGVNQIAAHFVNTQVAGVPLFFLVNAAFVATMTYGLVYWADIQNVEKRKPLFGVLPRRLVGILTVAFGTAALMMVLWGRIDVQADPFVSVARVSVVWALAAFGAALGDILPGESEGENIADVVDEYT
ncbi:DUF2391 family protein [Halobacterium zhouii]|uniref:DUF2391 family protein n=1 Tax=Halobacterium zhouii TaxID=2902624 RepID=UPI001E3C7D6D|nr:DUF2391 family protein [Halobacterium zhouii]